MRTRRSGRIQRDCAEQTTAWADGRHSGLWRGCWPAAHLYQQAVRRTAGRLRRPGVRRRDHARRPGRRAGHLFGEARCARLAQRQPPAVAPPVAGPRQDRPHPLAVSGGAGEWSRRLRRQDAHVGQRVAAAAPRAHGAVQQLRRGQCGRHARRRARRDRCGRCAGAIAKRQCAPRKSAQRQAAVEWPWQGGRPGRDARLGRGAPVRRRARAAALGWGGPNPHSNPNPRHSRRRSLGTSSPRYAIS